MIGKIKICGNLEYHFLKNIKRNKYIKIFVIFLLVIFFIILIVLFFGILIGKKMFGIRKTKVNELLELYDYTSNIKKT